MLSPLFIIVGISGDATIITIFTSNYDLEPSTREALQRLDMFKNLSVVKVDPVTGKEREAFSIAYLKQRVKESLASSAKGGKKQIVINQLDIPCGEGDIRPLVRYLRMLSFYIHALVTNSKDDDFPCVEVSVSFDASNGVTTVSTENNGNERSSLQLKSGSFQNLYPITPPPTLDSRPANIVAELQKSNLTSLQNPSELLQILGFYFAKTLAPTVIVSHKRQLIGDLVKILSESNGVRGIHGIDPACYKMMKSLYDAHDTPNLRDDILQILHDDVPGAASTCVAVELVCRTADAQLQIREIIEDTPSMTAFSTERSALQKDGLFFGVFVEGEITPEIKSRASLVI